MQPRVVELRYDLALAYVRARQLQRARAELQRARKLDPREPRIQDALKNLPKRPIRS
jgi:Flp pilus assembly protein TadD